MDASARNGGGDFTGAGHQGTRPGEDHAFFQCGPEVQPENPGDMVRFQHAAFAEGFRAAYGLFRGLKEKEDVPGQFVSVPGGVPGKAQQHGGMPVVTAGVHFPRMLRRVRQPRVLRNRQRVQIGPERGGFRLSRVQKGAHASGDGGERPQAKALQPGPDIGAGLRQLVHQLRDAVQSPAVFHY